MFKISQYPPLLLKIKTTSLNGLHGLSHCYLQHLWQYFLLPSLEIFFIHTRSLCFCKNDRYSSALGPLHVLTLLTGMSFVQLLHMFLLDLPSSLIKYIFSEASPKISVYPPSTRLSIYLLSFILSMIHFTKSHLCSFLDITFSAGTGVLVIVGLGVGSITILLAEYCLLSHFWSQFPVFLNTVNSLLTKSLFSVNLHHLKTPNADFIH